MHLRNEFVGKALPTSRIGLLLRIVEFGAAGAAHDVDYSAWLCLGAVAEGIVYLPLARDFTLGAGRTGIWSEYKRKGALVIVDVPGEYNVDMIGLENRR